MGTKFTEVYNCFLGKITDDEFFELTPADTIKDLQNLLIHSIPEFEFPRQNFSEYSIEVEKKLESEVEEADFIISIAWDELEDGEEPVPYVWVDNSTFTATLTPEEINIFATLMMKGWLQRQITSIEVTRMKYSGSDFKLTSQANHLAKLLVLNEEVNRQSTHLQRLYKRRKLDSDGNYVSNWGVLNYHTRQYTSQLVTAPQSLAFPRIYSNAEILSILRNAN